uniref:Uncharacterized protein LOC111099944 isoform X2 n=1 Tax=Crassostrea virginica TaxID=6565 RepID=A0A8B8A7Q3_CRAVI|nr:uncharacterized protein LOC111099944 isoform X2 [Crassostrea virginica]
MELWELRKRISLITCIYLGTCLEVNAKNGAISTISCTDFQSGCPENHYWNHQFFHYLACQNINTHHHCYVQHPSCPANVNVSDNVVDTTNQIINDGVSLYYLFLIVPIIAIIIVVLILWIFRKKMKRDRERLYARYQTTEPFPAEITDEDNQPTNAAEDDECEEDILLKKSTKKETFSSDERAQYMEYDLDQTTPRRAGVRRTELHLMIPEDKLPRRKSSPRRENSDEKQF